MLRLRAALFLTLCPGVVSLFVQAQDDSKDFWPQVISKVEPDYTEEAKFAKRQGTVVLRLVVDENGEPQDITIASPLGLGLDQQAIESVRQWRFKPGKHDGKPAAMAITVEVNFRLFPDGMNKKASRQEDQRTRYNDAISYLRDSVTGADPSKALRLLRPIAQAGYPQAQYSLGALYETGEGVAQNYDEAAKWYKRCADQGSASAQYRLSVLFELGKGVRGDKVRALLFAQLAAAQNFDAASGRVEGLAANMSAEQISKAREKAKGWKPKKHG